MPNLPMENFLWKVIFLNYYSNLYIPKWLNMETTSMTFFQEQVDTYPPPKKKVQYLPYNILIYSKTTQGMACV